MRSRYPMKATIFDLIIKVTLYALLVTSSNLGLSLALTTTNHRVNNQSSCNFQAVFNFGNSNSDTGGLSAVYGQVPTPNGETFFGAPAGRVCDGRLIIDFLAESLRLPHLSAYLNSIGANFSHGANFATAGSTVRPQNTTKSQSGYSPISLDVQFVQFSDFQKISQLVRKQGRVFEGLLPKAEYFSGALYTFDIGQNDFTAGYRLNMTTEQVKAYIPDVIDQLSNVVRIEEFCKLLSKEGDEKLNKKEKKEKKKQKKKQ